MAEATGSFEVNGRRYSLPTSLTLGEMADAERYFGVEFGAALGTSSIRMAAALMWIAIRREDPSVTIEDIRDLDASVFESVVGDSGPLANASSDDGPASSEASGEPSEQNGVSRVVTPEATGSHSSDTGSASDLLTSRT